MPHGHQIREATDSMLSILDLMGRTLNNSQGLPEYHSVAGNTVGRDHLFEERDELGFRQRQCDVPVRHSRGEVTESGLGDRGKG